MTRHGIGMMLGAALLAYQPAQETAALAVTLAAEKAVYTLGEPVVVNVTIRNLGAAREIPSRLEPEYGVIVFSIRRSDDRAGQVFRPWAVFDNAGNQSLAAGQVVVVPSRIFFGAGGWTFQSTGGYVVSAKFGRHSSNEFPLRIEPGSAEEATWGRRLVENNQAGRYLLLDGGDHLRDGIPLLEQLAETQTPLGGYAANALGISAATPYINLRTGDRRGAQLERAVPLLQRSRTLLPEGHFRLQNFSILNRSLRRMGRVPEAVQLQQQYRSELQQLALDPAIRAHMEAIIRR